MNICGLNLFEGENIDATEPIKGHTRNFSK